MTAPRPTAKRAPERRESIALPPVVQALLGPETYPERPASVEFTQTHISYVFLAGSSVYKLKKPVDFGFLDFSTPELRHAACLEEVRLNQRLSPDVYLGVVPIAERDGRISVDGDGPAIDWAVHMRRLPAERMLETLIEDKAALEGTGRLLGETVGQFHLSAERSARIAAIGGSAAVEQNWRENFEQVRPFRGQTIDAAADDRIQTYVDAFLRREASLLAERDEGGFIRDLHGDLRSAQIWILEALPAPPPSLTPAERDLLARMDGIRILDCIEFNERLRFCDTASDIAFLAMDLVARGRTDIAQEMLGRCLEVTGDGRLPLLLNFYSCYRAYVRGKVDSLGLTQREIDAAQRRRLRTRARRFFRVAERYAAGVSTPRLVLMMGVSGSGKSHLARLLAVELGAALVSSDITRKRLMGVSPTASAGMEAYATDVTERTYATLVDEARVELERGHAVILDATYLQGVRRAPARQLAEELRLPFTLIWCEAAPELLEQRLAARERDAWRVSDADRAVLRTQLDQVEPPNELPRESVIRVDTGQEMAPLLRRIRRRLGVA